MKLDDLKHLPVARGPSAHASELNLPEIPVELAEVEFEQSGRLRPIYVNGIHIPDEKPNEPYLVWTNHVNKQTGKRCNVLSTELSKITTYKHSHVETVSGHN